MELLILGLNFVTDSLKFMILSYKFKYIVTITVKTDIKSISNDQIQSIKFEVNFFSSTFGLVTIFCVCRQQTLSVTFCKNNNNNNWFRKAIHLLFAIDNDCAQIKRTQNA